MSHFVAKLKVTGISRNMTTRVKRDADGKAVKKEVRHGENVFQRDVYESCERWNITFVICGTAERHGTLTLTTINPEEAAKFELDKSYEMTIGGEIR